MALVNSSDGRDKVAARDAQKTLAKQAFRAESERRHLALPIAERLRIALSLITPRDSDGRRDRR